MGHLSVLPDKSFKKSLGHPQEGVGPQVSCCHTCLGFSASQDRWRTGSGEGRREENIGKINQMELWEGRDPALVNSGSSRPSTAAGRERMYRDC